MKRTVLILLGVLLAVAAAFGCSSKSSERPESSAYKAGYTDSYYADYDMPAEPAAEEAYYDGESKASNGIRGDAGASDAAQALANRKIIRNADVTVQTLAFDAFVEALNNAVTAAGGYIESSSVGGRSIRSSEQLRNARFTIRIPADRLDAFLSDVAGLGNVTSQSTSLRDVTTNYVDSEKHLEALRTEQNALLEILAKATTVEDIITVQDRLTYVRYEIESYEGILRTYDDQVDLSTVSLRVDEVERETPVEEESFGDEVSRRFSESLEDVGDGFKRFAAGFLGSAPVIIVTLLILGLIALIVILIVRAVLKSAKKRQTKPAAPQSPAPQSPAPEQKDNSSAE